MSYEITVAKQGNSVLTATDPNDFVFHSGYNTFKIVRSGVKQADIPASTDNHVLTEPHFLDFVPLVNAMLKHDGYDQACPPNTANIYFLGVKAGLFSTGISFVSIKADDTNIYFTVSNSLGSPQTVYIRYYCVETI